MLFHDTADAYEKMWASIRDAKHSIDLMTYILRFDTVGLHTLSLLKQAAQRGCRVRLSYDAAGCIGLNSPLTPSPNPLDELRIQPNVEIVCWRPFVPYFIRYFARLFPQEVSPILRNHRKLLIIDAPRATSSPSPAPCDHPPAGSAAAPPKECAATTIRDGTPPSEASGGAAQCPPAPPSRRAFGRFNLLLPPPEEVAAYVEPPPLPSGLAFTGGLNCGNEYCGSRLGGSNGFRDSHCRVRGPAALELRDAFVDAWDGREEPTQSAARRRRASARLREFMTASRTWRDLEPRPAMINAVGQSSLAWMAAYRRVAHRYMRDGRTSDRAAAACLAAAMDEVASTSPPPSSSSSSPSAMEPVGRTSTIAEALDPSPSSSSSPSSASPPPSPADGASAVPCQDSAAPHSYFVEYPPRPMDPLGFLEVTRNEPALRPVVVSEDAAPAAGGAVAKHGYPSVFESVEHSGVLAHVLVGDIRASRTELYRVQRRVFAAAQRELWIVTPYFVPPIRHMRAVASAARRGVRVTIVTGAMTSTDPRWIFWASQHVLLWLSKLPHVRVFLYRDGARGGAVMHAKLMSVDGIYGSVGSFNQDALSHKNLEATVGCFDVDVAHAIRQAIICDIKNSDPLVPTRHGVAFRIVAFAAYIFHWICIWFCFMRPRAVAFHSGMIMSLSNMFSAIRYPMRAFSQASARAARRTAVRIREVAATLRDRSLWRGRTRRND